MNITRSLAILIIFLGVVAVALGGTGVGLYRLNRRVS